jgi:hypothetical protein
MTFISYQIKMIEIKGTWREDTSLVCTPSYKRKFALFPVQVTGGKVWMKFYYKKYNHWHHRFGGRFLEGAHVELAELISEDEYIVRKLAETL